MAAKKLERSGQKAVKPMPAQQLLARADRMRNLQRAAFVVAEVARHGGVCVCAMIAPYTEARQRMRSMVREAAGDIFEIYLSTSLSVCEQRDLKRFIDEHALVNWTNLPVSRILMKSHQHQI